MRHYTRFLIGIALVALMVSPGLAATDTVNVTITVPAFSSFAAGVDVTLTAVAADLDNTYVFSANASTMTLQDNTAAWTLTAALSVAYTDYTLWIEDTQASGNATGAGFKQIPVTPTTVALDTFAGYGTAGNYSYGLDWLATGLSWTLSPASQIKTVTFTHTT